MPAEEIGFQRIVVGDARHAIEFALIGDRIDSFRRCEGSHNMDLALEDQILGDFSRSVRIRLAVLDHKLERMNGAIDFNGIVEHFPGLVEGVRHLLIEQRQGTRLGSDQADLDGLRTAKAGRATAATAAPAAKRLRTMRRGTPVKRLVVIVFPPVGDFSP